jgi:hypothetical protein
MNSKKYTNNMLSVIRKNPRTIKTQNHEEIN